MRQSVTVQMAAPPATVWALVSDVTRIGEFSPETFDGQWLDGATGPAVGTRFRGHVKRNGKGPVYWTTCRVTECETNTRFGFSVLGPAGVTLNTWRYDLAPADGGTSVTESFALPDRFEMKIYWAAMGWARGKTNREGMKTTLERIRAVVE